MAVTLKDIADRAGVSPITVSYALRDRGRLSPETRKNVRQIAKQLGYRANTSARAMREGRFGCVSLILGPGFELGGMPGGLLTGIDEQLARRDMHVTICHAKSPDGTHHLGTSELKPKAVQQSMVDGHFIDLDGRDPEWAKNFEDEQLPMIWLRAKRSHDCVYVDEEQGGYDATKVLIELGHRRIGCVYGPSDVLAVEQRIRGYRRAMKDAGLGSEELVFPPESGPGQPSESATFSSSRYLSNTAARKVIATQWLAREDRPTAIFGVWCNDADIILGSALPMGLVPPRDLSIITVHDKVVNYGFPITTCMFHMTRLGTAAGEMMLAKLDHPDIKLPARVEAHQLYEATTTGPPPMSS